MERKKSDIFSTQSQCKHVEKIKSYFGIIAILSVE